MKYFVDSHMTIIWGLHDCDSCFVRSPQVGISEESSWSIQIMVIQESTGDSLQSNCHGDFTVESPNNSNFRVTIKQIKYITL